MEVLGFVAKAKWPFKERGRPADQEAGAQTVRWARCLSPWFSPLSRSAFPGHCSLVPLLSHPFVSTCLCTFSPHRPSLPKGGSAQWWTTPERLGRSEREGSRRWLSLGDSVYFSLLLKHTSVLLKQDLQAHILPAHRNSNTIHKACLSDCLVPRPYPPSQWASKSPSSPC